MKYLLKPSYIFLLTSVSTSVPSSLIRYLVVIFNWSLSPNILASTAVPNKVDNSALTLDDSTGFSNLTWKVLPPTKSTPSSKPLTKNETQLTTTTNEENK